MKKIIIVLLLSIAPIFVFADMGAPMTDQYKAEVINPNGAFFYKYEYDSKASKDRYVKLSESIPYKKVITIIEEPDLNNDVKFVSVVGYDNYILLSDVVGLVSEFKYDTKEFGEPIKSTVLKDIEIRKGPAEGFPGTGVIIKSGEEIKIREYNEESTPWYYVEYNNTNGFINSLKGTFTLGDVKGTAITSRNINILDGEDKVIGTIPVNTILKGLKTVDAWSRSNYVTYKGISGYVKTYYLSYENKAKVTVSEKVNVYEQLLDEMEKAKVIGTVEKGTVFETLYPGYYCSTYYEGSNIKGWLYSDVLDSDSICKGFKIEYLDVEEIEDEEEEELEEVEEDIIEIPSSEKKVTKNTILLCVLGACIVFVTILSTILLINRKKDK